MTLPAEPLIFFVETLTTRHLSIAGGWPDPGHETLLGRMSNHSINPPARGQMFRILRYRRGRLWLYLRHYAQSKNELIEPAEQGFSRLRRSRAQ